jgi:hypothetical protein
MVDAEKQGSVPFPTSHWPRRETMRERLATYFGKVLIR